MSKSCYLTAEKLNSASLPPVICSPCGGVVIGLLQWFKHFTDNEKIVSSSLTSAAGLFVSLCYGQCLMMLPIPFGNTEKIFK